MSQETLEIPGLNVNDIVVIEFERYSYDGVLLIRAETESAEVQVQAFFDVDSLENAPSGFTNHTLSIYGATEEITLPVALPSNNRISRVIVNQGRISLRVTCSTPFRYYLEQPENPPRIA